MALSHAAKLLSRANSGERLKSEERRHCVEYLGTTSPELSNGDMAEMFQVSERVIRMDKSLLRERRAMFLKKDLSKDLALVIADIAMDFEKQVLDIEKSKAKARLGSRSYLDHCKAVLEMRLSTVKAFQEIGYLPKNLGNMTVEKFEYKAIVSNDGSVSTRNAATFGERAIDAEFADIPRAALTSGESHIVDNQKETEIGAKEDQQVGGSPTTKS